MDYTTMGAGSATPVSLVAKEVFGTLYYIIEHSFDNMFIC
jgi:hypothetical protein